MMHGRWQAVAASGMAMGAKGGVVAAKALALTAARATPLDCRRSMTPNP